MEYIPVLGQRIERKAHFSFEMKNDKNAGQDIKKMDVVSIEIDELQNDTVETSITGQLESLSPLSLECCIYRIPKKLRTLNSEAYTPRIVSIGPFHHGEKDLQAMEEHKLRYLQNFLYHTDRSLEDYIEIVKTWEGRARRCYAETIELTSDEFVKMILVDGSFIVELLLKYYFRQSIDDGDPIFYQRWMMADVQRDMLLLENQLPFFVLEGLFNMFSVSTRDKTPSILNSSLEFFSYSLGITKLSDTILSPGIQHFIDFVRWCYRSSFPIMPENEGIHMIPPSVTMLQEAGIKFKTRENSSLFDITFANGILEIPPLLIGDRPVTLFRNLIAFEQSHYKDDYFAHYMVLLHQMINTSKDADILIHHRIITGVVGSREDVLELFNTISKKVTISDQYYFSSLRKNLNAYCRTPWHKWKAALKRDYFNSPWKVISVVVAVIFLSLTIIQAVSSVISL